MVEATVCVFSAEITGGTLHCDGIETVAHRWVAPAEVADLLAMPYPRSLFEG